MSKSARVTRRRSLHRRSKRVKVIESEDQRRSRRRVGALTPWGEHC